jgi:hypothetical protein
MNATEVIMNTINMNGEPRMGEYSGSYAYDLFQDHRLFYLWCGSLY